MNTTFFVHYLRRSIPAQLLAHLAAGIVALLIVTEVAVAKRADDPQPSAPAVAVAPLPEPTLAALGALVSR